MHSNQIPTSKELVRALLQSQYPVLADEPIASEALHGTDNDVYRLGLNHSVRLPIIDWAIANEDRMRPWLSWLQDRLNIDVPVPLYYGEPDCGFPHTWSIYPWFEGTTLEFGVEDPQVAQDIAAFLQQIRTLPTESVPTAGRSPHALDANVRECLDQLTVEDRREELIAFWESFMKTPAWDGDGSLWMHGDVAPGNLVFKDGCFVAAIDWSGLGVGDPANDLQVAWNMLTGEARSAFREAMSVDDQTWYRARARAFAQASFQLPYYRDSLPALANQAKYVFNEILNEVTTR